MQQMSEAILVLVWAIYDQRLVVPSCSVVEQDLSTEEMEEKSVGCLFLKGV